MATRATPSPASPTRPHGISCTRRTSRVTRSGTTSNTPFLLAHDGVEATEIEPWQQDGETWRRLAVRFPADITTHNTEQTFYFGEDFLLRRHDYAGDVLGGFATAHYTTDHRTFDGFVFPTRRWVVPRLPDGSTLDGPVVVSLDIRSVSVS